MFLKVSRRRLTTLRKRHSYQRHSDNECLRRSTTRMQVKKAILEEIVVVTRMGWWPLIQSLKQRSSACRPPTIQ